MAFEDKAPAVTKSISIIRYINKAGSSGSSLVDISRDLVITKSHCFNILKGLVEAGWLIHDDVRQSYILSTRILGDISSVFNRGIFSTVIHEELDMLSKATGIPCVLTRVEADGSFTVIDRSEVAGELLFPAPIGFRYGADSPAQMRVRLAYLTKEQQLAELEKWKPKAYTPATIVNKKKLLKEVELTRARGYGISRAEFAQELVVLAAAIFDTFGNVQMILQCPGLATKIQPKEAAIARDLIASTARMNALLGNPPV